MKTKAMITVLVSAALILTAPLATFGAGPGGGSSGGGNAGTAAGALYGDLYVIERDGNGAPLTRPVTYVDSETGANVTVQCQQPLAKTCGLLPLWGESGSFDPELYDPCSVQTDYTVQLQSVSFGRESVSRAPATVIDKAYAEALKSINLAAPSCGDSRAIKLDPAGRITLCLATETVPVTYAWKTIDAPLENLGLYRAAMTSGCFGPVSEEMVGEEGVRITVTTELSGTAKGYLTASGLDHLRCDAMVPNPKADMLSAAVFIAAGADKASPINLDEIINVNNYLGVNTWTYTTSKKVKTLTINYFQFKVSGGPGGWFAYKRGSDACVSPTYAALLNQSGNLFSSSNTNVFGTSPPGVVLRGANGVAITVCREGLPLPAVCDDPDTNPVYGPNLNNIGCGGANWFAQAAEDARKTIWYLHNWRVPEIAY